MLARSDAQQRDAFLAHVAEHRAPRIAAHWAFMLEPLVADHSERDGALRFRQIEYYRMPLMAYLAMDDPRALTRNDFVRLGLVTGAATATPAPRYAALSPSSTWPTSSSATATTASGPRRRRAQHALPVQRPLAGRGGRRARSEFFTCRDRGVLAQFRHQHFLLFLIAHFQKAALLMFSDRLVEALKRLDVGDAGQRASASSARSAPASRASCASRTATGSTTSPSRRRRGRCSACARSTSGLDPLYAEVKERIGDMNEYLDTDSLRRQANTVVRLTVVTIFGLIGTVTTGFLGMNLLAEADAPLAQTRADLRRPCSSLTTALTVYTMVKSKRLSDLLDALSDERLSVWMKAKSLLGVWQRRSD